MDWTATILSAAGTKADPAHALDGDDLLPVCKGMRTPYDRTLFWRTQAREAARVGTLKYLKEPGGEHLFDFSVDPGEKAELRGSRTQDFERIRSQYLAWNAQVLPRLAVPLPR